ncbi:MAG: hypothetical protein KBB95_16555 [Deltaproteobacteria bacterium]|nr:hypothetical protein [Deltaproteobacteria bacterium]
MTTTPPDAPPEASPRAALMAAIFLTMAGVYGVGHGVESMSAPRTIDATAESNAELREAMHAIQANPYSGALGASNIVVSVMLIVSSMLITTRRASSMWFVRQAIVANLLFIVARGAVETHYLWSLGSALDPIGRDAYERTQSWLASPGPPPDFTSMTRSGMLFSQLLIGGLSGAVHLFLGYKATRPAVRAFIETAGRPR